VNFVFSPQKQAEPINTIGSACFDWQFNVGQS